MWESLFRATDPVRGLSDDAGGSDASVTQPFRERDGGRYTQQSAGLVGPASRRVASVPEWSSASAQGVSPGTNAGP